MKRLIVARQKCLHQPCPTSNKGGKETNKESPEVIRVREEIIPLVCSCICNPCVGSKCGFIQGDWAFGKAKRILSIKGILVEADDQKLPTSFATRDGKREQWLKKAGWRKVV